MAMLALSVILILDGGLSFEVGRSTGIGFKNLDLMNPGMGVFGKIQSSFDLMENVSSKIFTAGIQLIKGFSFIQIPMIQMVQHLLQTFFDGFEIHQHAIVLQGFSANGHKDPPIVPVQVFTFSPIVAQVMCPRK